MKKTILILIGVGLLMILLIARLIFQQTNHNDDERKWFAKELGYEFTARVDTVWIFNENAGRLRCVLITGDPQIEREDSLKRFFKQYDMLYLIFKRSADSIYFMLPENIKLVARGDSVRVSSRENSIEFFREGKPLMTDSLTETLTGYSRPFFMKRDKK